MTDSLTVGDRNYSAEDIIPLLRQYGLMPQLIRELVIDHAIAAIELTEEEQARAQARFDQTFNIQSDEQRQSFAAQRQLSPEAFAQLMLREEKLTKFKLETWGAKLESYFLQRKSSLDRVLYSLIRTQEPGLAQELYFRINDDGQPFADLAREYSEGQEAQTGGLIGPVELSVPHPSLARILSISQPGQLWPPTRVGEWFVVVRLEKFLPAKMDDATLQRLLDELFSVWLKEEIEKNMGILSQTKDSL
ncbi:peptidylprolyl isomerase [Pseudanabaena sp. FACHB-2040]|uniref:peptidylprolyl isomerase n=1 Tax=Pseudanabaena sp. FACHB-2040 TaxID=2692859 RepID=UPI00168462D4|nr:peptidylprolyl isomerase [Pseudanabaena sp. FACHB-2040]